MFIAWRYRLNNTRYAKQPHPLFVTIGNGPLDARTYGKFSVCQVFAQVLGYVLFKVTDQSTYSDWYLTIKYSGNLVLVDLGLASVWMIPTDQSNHSICDMYQMCWLYAYVFAHHFPFSGLLSFLSDHERPQGPKPNLHHNVRIIIWSVGV